MTLTLPKRETEVVIAWLQAELARAEQKSRFGDGGELGTILRAAIENLDTLCALAKWETGASVIRKMDYSRGGVKS